jgi:hypothetical protein
MSDDVRAFLRGEAGEPGAGAVHVPQPMGKKRGEKNRNFLTRLYERMRELFKSGEPITPDQFEQVFRSARGAAGGMAYPVKPQAAEPGMCADCGAEMEDGVCPECGAMAEDDDEPAQASETGADLADIAAQGHTHRLYQALACAEAPEWIPYLPKPGAYTHPRYGEISITRERNARFVANFQGRVYQDRLPIDAEHETKLSGAVGWITAMRVNADGSADAQVEWTDRGRAFFADSRFRYFSPEWYDAWQRPETGETIRDVAIGGALTTRPFFKDPALRPLFASEGRLTIDDIPPDNTQGDDMAEEQTTQSYAEIAAQLDALRAENATLRSASETAAAQSTQLAEQIQRMAAERQQERFGALIRNDGARWFGEAPQHLTVLGTLAQTFGEQSPEFSAYVAQQRAVAEALRSSAAFNEAGQDGGGRGPETAEAKIESLARARAAEKGLPFAQAYTEVLTENPALYTEHRTARSA